MKKTTISKKALYELIWVKSIQKVAAELNIQPNKLKQLCDKENIPTPRAGHWSKLRHGKTSPKTALTGNSEKKLQLLTFNTKTNSKALNSSRLSKPHPLVKEAKISLEQAKPMQYSYSSPSMVTTGNGLVNITVTPKLIKRALLFMDSLIKKLEAKDHSVGFKKYYGTVINIQTIKFEFTLREKSNRFKKSDVAYDSYQMIPSGALIFKMYSYPRKEWMVSKTKSLLQKIPDIITYLEDVAEEELQWKKLNEENKRSAEKERLKKENIEQLRKIEIEKFNQFYENSKRFQKAKQLRKYIKVIEEGKLKIEIDKDSKNWVEWAKKKADWVDPLVEGSDPILGNYSNYLF